MTTMTFHLLAPSPLAGRLALAHHIHRLVEAGEVESYSAAAKTLGVTKAHLANIVSLRLLAPDLQAELVTGTLDLPACTATPATQEALWPQQRYKLQRHLRSHRLNEMNGPIPGG